MICKAATAEISSLDQKNGIENLFEETGYYRGETNSHSYMIRKLSEHTFLGFFANKGRFSTARIEKAEDYFLRMPSPLSDTEVSV